MKTFYVTNRTQVSKISSRVNATHVLSLLDPGIRPYLHPKTDRNNWLLIICCDLLNEGPINAPTEEHVKKILNWGEKLPDDAVVVVHCEAGISRSTAATLALLVQTHGNHKISECVDLLVAVRPTAIPNPIIIKYADKLLGCEGKLIEAADKLSKNNLAKFLIV